MDFGGLMMEQARRLEAEGQWPVAEILYRKILEATPDHAPAAHALGLLLYRSERMTEGLAWMGKALALAPATFGDWRALGGILAEQGRLANDLCNLAQTLTGLGQWDEAAAAFQDALNLRPDFVTARIARAGILDRLRLHAEAADEYRRVILLLPHIPEARNNLGSALQQSGDFEGAIAAYRQAIAINPDYATAHDNLGLALFETGDFKESEAACRRAIAIRPDYPEAYFHLGNALESQGNSRGALDAYRQAIALRPDYVDPHFNSALVLLKLGQFREGWAEYEWRRLTPKGRTTITGRDWNGEKLPGGTILLHGEQGLGDVLQFARYAPMIAASGARVILRAHRPLIQLLRTMDPAIEVIANEDPVPAFDRHLPLMSLPHVLGTTLETIPAPTPYLHPDPAEVASWHSRTSDLPGLKVGLVWAGNPRPEDPESHRIDRRRSLRLEHFAGLAGIDGVSLVSLQKGIPAIEAKAPPRGMALIDWMDEIEDFAETAALAANLDLVISADTSVAHLAGALGMPVWILSRFDGCWRWLEDRDDTPWYPTARLFRQRTPGDWGEVMERVIRDLRPLAGRPSE